MIEPLESVVLSWLFLILRLTIDMRVEGALPHFNVLPFLLYFPNSVLLELLIDLAPFVDIFWQVIQVSSLT